MYKSYFTFSKNQSRAIITLLSGIFTALLFYYFMPFIFGQKNNLPHEDLYPLMAKLQLDEKQRGFTDNASRYNTPQIFTPFPFDPNTIDSTGLLKMGFREKLIHTIINYRNKGGRFYNKEGLQRIYGLHPAEYKQLEPYIIITDLDHGRDFRSNTKEEFLVIEINKADTSQLIKLKGIGSKLAMNIVSYRNQLGGFVQKEQLKEVYGISAETFAVISPHVRVISSPLKRINLNEATFQEINSHPYLKGALAKSIVDLRKKKNYHFEDLSQLREIELLDDKLFRKIAPYIYIQ